MNILLLPARVVTTTIVTETETVPDPPRQLHQQSGLVHRLLLRLHAGKDTDYHPRDRLNRVSLHPTGIMAWIV